MSGRNTPVSGAGPRRSSHRRVPTVRRRASSLSVITVSSTNGGPHATTLAEWKGPSMSDLPDWKAPSQLNFDSIGRKFGLSYTRGTDSKRSSAGLSTLGRTEASGSHSPPIHTSSDPPLSPRDKPLPPCPVGSETEEPDTSTRRGTYCPPPLVSSNKPLTIPIPRRRTRSTWNGGAVNPQSTALEDALTIVNVTYDRESQRLTIVDGFPGIGGEPLVVDVSPSGVGSDPPTSPPSHSPSHLPYREIAQRLTRKVDSLISTAKTRLPRAFKFVITTPQNESRSHEPHSIGEPYGFIHTVEVKVEPKSGTLIGVPQEWLIPPPVLREEHGFKDASLASRPILKGPLDPPSESVLGRLRRGISSAGRIAAHVPRPRLLSLRRPTGPTSGPQGQLPNDPTAQLNEKMAARSGHSRSNMEKRSASSDNDPPEYTPPILERALEQPPRITVQMDPFSLYAGTVYHGLLHRWQSSTSSTDLNPGPDLPEPTPALSHSKPSINRQHRFPTRI